MQDVYKPTMIGNTNGDRWIYSLDLEATIDQCNLQFEQLRAWRTDNKGEVK